MDFSLDRDKLLSTLIGFKTVNPPGNELELCYELKKILSPAGFRCSIQDIGGNRGNIIAEYGPENADKSLMLTGHLDVVPAGKGWAHDPFDLTVRNNKYYGRGVCDMKGAIAAMILAAFDVIALNKDLQHKLLLGFASDEEISGTGTRAMLESGIKPTYAVIGEPTEMNVCIAHRGVDRYKITVHGRSGHASAPGESLNPLYFTAKILSAIEELNDKLSLKTHSILPAPTIAATIVNCGIQGNVIPETAEITVDRRTIPGESKAAVLAEIKSITDSIAEKYSGISIDFQSLAWIPPAEACKDTTLQSQSVKILQNLGLNHRVKDFPAGCDLYQFLNAGTDAVLIGPGSLKQAHTTDEYITLAEMDNAQNFYRELILKLLF